MNIYKKWLLQLTLTSILLLSPILIVVMGFNYYIDPLWNFNHANDYNDYQMGFDERQQKTNYITTRPFAYDSLIIGTSRVSYMDQHQFQKNDVYNYSLSEMHIDEYLPYINYAKKQKNGSFDKIYMELYFESFKIVSSPYKEPSVFFENASNPLYKYTTLFSRNTWEQSMTNLAYSKANHFGGLKSYNRDNVGTTTYVNDNMNEAWKKSIAQFEQNKATNNYPYDPAYKKKLELLMQENPKTQFIVFTDPIPSVKLKAILNDPLYWNVYERWIYELIDVFGEVHSFQAVSEYTTNEKYWFDGAHYYPIIGDKMIAHLEGREQDPSFHILVNKDNIEEYLATLQTMIHTP